MRAARVEVSPGPAAADGPLGSPLGAGREITVVLPHYACEAWIRRALDSLFAQTLASWQLVVVDDASPDPGALRAVLRGYRDERLTALRTTQNVGQFRIYNRLLPRLASRFLAFQDADDWSDPRRFEILAGLLDRHGWDAVGSHLLEVDEAGAPLGELRPPEDVNRALAWRCRGGVLFGATLVCRVDLARRIGGYDGTTRFGADSDFAYRAVFSGTLRNHPAPLYHWTRRAGSLTRAAETGFGSRARRAYVRRIRRRFYGNLLRRPLGGPPPAALLARPNDVSFDLLPLE